MKLDRRRFLGWAMTGGASCVLPPGTDVLATQANQEPWLRFLAQRKHRAFLDTMRFFPDGTPFRRAEGLQTILRSSYGIDAGDVAVVVGMHSAGLAHLVSFRVWQDLGLAGWIRPALNGADKNLMTEPLSALVSTSEQRVRELRARGIQFLACRQTIERWARRRAAEESRRRWEAIAEQITKGLYEGVQPVPAMIAATVLGQEAGARYVAID